MTQSAEIEVSEPRRGSSLGLSADLLSAARYSVANTLSDLGGTARMHVAARASLARGRPEEALLHYGRGIRQVKLARQSLRTYRAVDRLVHRYPEALADYRVPPVAPEQFLFFVGHSRSGHSLVGSLLDAHPNLLVAHEVHALKLLQEGHSPAEVIKAIQYNSAFFARFGRGYSGYDYQVAAQSQGASSALNIIGDNKANGTTAVLRRDPGFVERLRDLLPIPFTFVHVIRNPYDNIATRARRVGTSALLAAHGYFINVKVIAKLKRKHPELVHEIYLDDLTANPGPTLERLLGAIGITDVPEDYLKACAEIVFPETRRTRNDIDWPDDLRRWVRSQLPQYDFLSRFADEG